jgi:cell division protein FtsB
MAATAARASAARAAARRHPRARSRAGRGGIRWDRVARVSLLVVLGVVLVSYIGPASNYVRSRRLAADTRAQVQELRHDNSALRARAKHLRGLESVELEARKSGMARPGERVYVIRGLPKER